MDGMTQLFVVALALTLAVELPVVSRGYRLVAPAWRRLGAALAVNAAVHGLLWQAVPFSGAWLPRVVLGQLAAVLAEAIAYRLLLGGSAGRAAAVSAIANLASTLAGVALIGMMRM